MRTLLVTVVVIVLSSITQARVWTTIYRCDETTPLAPVDPNQPSVYRDIMVGTKLVIVISSDTDASWLGRLQFSTDENIKFSLYGRRHDANDLSYTGSCFAAADASAGVWDIFDIGIGGFEFSTGAFPVSGDWFILDYRAEEVGSCSLELYDLNGSVDVLTQTLYTTHVPSRDFDHNSIVDFEDYAMLTSHWHTSIAPDSSMQENQFDLNSDGSVDIGDLILLSDYWLERTDCNEPAGDPNHLIL